MRLLAVLLISSVLPLAAQNASVVGDVRDAQNAAVPGANVTLTNEQTKISQTTTSTENGYEFPIIRPGAYSLRVEKPGFKAFVQKSIIVQVDQRGRADATLEIGDTSTVVTIDAGVSAVQTDSSSLGEVIDTKKIVEIPLNGRFFLDLALLTPGTVVPSTNNRTFLATPSGIGATGINASGAREDSTNYLFDGINLSDMVQNQITFSPNIDMIQEFKVQTNSFTAEYGRNAGIVINGVSKSGTNQLHGTAYEFVRNEKFDAKNYFDKGDAPIAPFKRNIFGYSIGGPVYRNKTFFFTSYEGRQGRESVSLKTVVPTDAQRAGVTNPVIKKLVGLMPSVNTVEINFVGFVGSVPKKRELNQFTGRIDHVFNEKNSIYGTFMSNRDSRTEPTLQGNNLPGFGDSRPAKRYFLALNYVRVLTPTLTNELRGGLNRVRIDFSPDSQSLNPVDFGMRTNSAVFPQINISGAAAFGGITGFPQGRGDTTFQYTDTVSWVRGRHSIKFGAEFRRFRNNNFNAGTGGVINFPTLAAFLSGTPSSVTQQQVPATPALRVSALDTFAQDDWKVSSRLTLNLGMRWEYNGVPNEKYDRLGVYDFTKQRLITVGTEGVERPYPRQFTNFGPRVGFSFDPTGKATTVVRGGFGIYFDQPVTNVVSPLGSNPPFSRTVSFTNTTQNPITFDLTQPFNLPGGTSPIFNANAIAPDFGSGYVLQYNFNIQREQFGTVFQAGYVGSGGRHLRLVRDYNQGIPGTAGVRPNPKYSQIDIQEPSSLSSYNALWISANRRLSKGLTFQTSYTFSKSIDLNSVGSSNPQIQNANNLRAERALSDFDARHRFVLSGIYLFPFKGSNGFMSRAVEGWSISPIVNLQSGNPYSPIITLLRSGSLRAFDRPDVVPGQPLTVTNPSPSQWVNQAAFTLNNLNTFGNAGRNILTAPGFQDIDLSLAKNTAIRENIGLQFRAELFNVFNHPNFGQPINNANNNTPANINLPVNQFGKITQTRTVRGDLGSSRQLQLGLKLVF
jgi:hypothetical protein